MNKIIFGLVVGLSVVSCNTKPDKDDETLKKQTMEACENAAIQPNMTEGQKTALKSYCSCSTDKMIGEFSYVEMMQMNEPTPELKSRLEKLIAPCIKELEVKMDELKN